MSRAGARLRDATTPPRAKPARVGDLGAMLRLYGYIVYENEGIERFKKLRSNAVFALLPCFRILPAHVAGVSHQDQQTFAAVEETEAEKIHVKKPHQRAQHYVDETESHFTLVNYHACTEGRVTICMLDEAFQARISMVNQVSLKVARPR